MRRKIFIPTILLFLAFSVFSANPTQKFLRDDPLWVDEDNLSIPKPASRELSKTVDFLQKTFLLSQSERARATNINTLGEVPDSSWYTNRLNHHSMTLEEIKRGPNQGSGPDFTKPVKISSAKREGATPGFLIKDSRGERYFLKLDPYQHPQMATSTEVVATKFLYAFGYSVPENYVAYWNPVEYKLSDTATVLWDSGKETPLCKKYVETLLKNVNRRKDGTIQVMASKFLPGEPLGPFDYYGIRKDDPNDIYRHEDRRELRGLRIFAAWLNHNDSDSVNSLDMYHTDEQGRKYVKHYLLDFGSSLGSAAIRPHSRRTGYEYAANFSSVFRSLLTFGLWERPCYRYVYPDIPSIGRIESKNFQPQLWKPDYPNPAFDRMDIEDAFWATRIVLRFSDETIKALVDEGKWDDPAAADFLARTLIERRDKIIHYYLSRINPLDEFQIESDNVHFVNVGLKARLAKQCEYEIRWYSLNNDTGETVQLMPPYKTDHGVVKLPQNQDAFLLAKFSTICADKPEWRKPVSVYIRNTEKPKVVGIER